MIKGVTSIIKSKPPIERYDLEIRTRRAMTGSRGQERGRHTPLDLQARPMRVQSGPTVRGTSMARTSQPLCGRGCRLCGLRVRRNLEPNFREKEMGRALTPTGADQAKYDPQLHEFRAGIQIRVFELFSLLRSGRFPFPSYTFSSDAKSARIAFDRVEFHHVSSVAENRHDANCVSNGHYIDSCNGSGRRCFGAVRNCG